MYTLYSHAVAIQEPFGWYLVFASRSRYLGTYYVLPIGPGT